MVNVLTSIVCVCPKRAHVVKSKYILKCITLFSFNTIIYTKNNSQNRKLNNSHIIDIRNNNTKKPYSTQQNSHTITTRPKNAYEAYCAGLAMHRRITHETDNTEHDSTLRCSRRKRHCFVALLCYSESFGIFRVALVTKKTIYHRHNIRVHGGPQKLIEPEWNQNLV